MTHAERMQQDREQVERWLRQCFAGREPHGDIYDAMEYSLSLIHISVLDTLSGLF